MRGGNFEPYRFSMMDAYGPQQSCTAYAGGDDARLAALSANQCVLDKAFS